MPDTPTRPVLSTASAIAMVDAIRDDLAEARRYVRKDPKSLDHYLAAACDPINNYGAMHRGHDLLSYTLLRRLADNLIVALLACRVDPEVSEGYIDGARHELAVIRGRLEKAEGGRAVKEDASR